MFAFRLSLEGVQFLFRRICSLRNFGFSLCPSPSFVCNRTSPTNSFMARQHSNWETNPPRPRPQSCIQSRERPVHPSFAKKSSFFRRVPRWTVRDRRNKRGASTSRLILIYIRLTVSPHLLLPSAENKIPIKTSARAGQLLSMLRSKQ